MTSIGSAAVVSMIWGVALAGGLWPFGGDKEPGSRGTIGGLEELEIELQTEPIVEDGAPLAREQYRIFLEISAGNPELRIEAMRRLGDLNLAAGEQAQFDGSGDQAFYAEAARMYVALLESNPGYSGTDLILYQLARIYEAMGESEQALVTLDRVVAEYPGSEFFDEAQFRRGEILFVGKRFAAAESAYAEVIAVGEDSKFYEQSLYKHGWSQFKLSHHDESLDSFMQLLDRKLVREDGVEGSEVLERMSRPQRELVDDTFRVLSITFSYMDGSESIDAMFAGRGEPYYADLLFAGLGRLYLDKERYTDAAETFSGFVVHHPTHPHAPDMQIQVIESYTLAKFPSLVLDAKRDYVRYYGLDSDFWVGRERTEWPDVVANLKANLSDLAEFDHALAQNGGDVADYERAAEWYRRYLAYFPDDPDSAKRNFLLADILFELERYDQATGAYLSTAYDYGPHKQAAEAGYAALIASRKHEEQLSGQDREIWHADSVQSALRFADAFPEHEQAAVVLTTVAEELFRDGNREEAIRVAGLIITLQPPAEMALERTAWTVIAHSQFDMQHYAEAERAYQRLSQMPAKDEVDRVEIQERIAASVYRQGEQAQAAGDTAAAVAQYLRVGDVQPGSDFVPNAMYDAAALLITDQQWGDAVTVLERFRGEFPEHQFADDVTQKLAVAYQASGQGMRAGAEYERIAGLEGVTGDLHREALWQAADLYADAGAVADQQRVYSEIVTRFPAPLSESIEARVKLADLAETQGQFAVRHEWLRSIIKADREAGGARSDRTRTLAAKASLELAAPARDAFLNVSLAHPLKDSLTLKKQRMEFALNAYGATADYGVAEVTTAATFEIANLYYRLSKDLMASERPGSLSEEELEQYDILLEEQAFPFEEQAIEIFQANADRAVEGIYDEWVRKSFVRLAELMPARYDKAERSETLVAQLD